MQSSLYAKFLGKALSLDQAKLALAEAWRGLGDFTIADLPNGFYYIRCENQAMQSKLLCESPWRVAACILQLAPWRESFQPALEKLSSAIVWIQIFRLPMELWEGEILEMVASQFGRVLKVDEHTIDRSRAKFARVCVELDLNNPLLQGTWVKYGTSQSLSLFCMKNYMSFATNVVVWVMGKRTAFSPAVASMLTILCPLLPQKWRWCKLSQ